MARSTRLPALIATSGAMLIAALVVACGAAAPGGTASTSEPAPSSRVTPVGSASATGGSGAPAASLCGLFTPAELTSVLGAQPAPGSTGGPLESLCQWDAGDAFLMIQKVPVDYFEDRLGADGYRELQGIGDDAYVGPHPFGRVTAARTADAAYVVIANEGSEEASQIDVLRRFIERSPGAPVLAAPNIPAETDPPATPGSAGGSACVVTTDEVSEATGIPMTQGQGCSWSAADPETLFEVLVTNVPTSYFQYFQPEQAFEGVGDEAYVDGTGVYVRIGDRAFSTHVSTLSLSDDETLETALAIARRAADGLR